MNTTLAEPNIYRRLIFIRHGEPAGQLTNATKPEQRPLSLVGQMQAGGIGKKINEFTHRPQIWISPPEEFCIQTAAHAINQIDRTKIAIHLLGDLSMPQSWHGNGNEEHSFEDGPLRPFFDLERPSVESRAEIALSEILNVLSGTRICDNIDAKPSVNVPTRVAIVGQSPLLQAIMWALAEFAIRNNMAGEPLRNAQQFREDSLDLVLRPGDAALVHLDMRSGKIYSSIKKLISEYTE